MTTFEYIIYLIGICSLIAFIAMVSAQESNRSIKSLQLYFGVSLLWVVFEFAAAQISSPESRLWVHKLSGTSGIVSGILFSHFLYAVRYKPVDMVFRGLAGTIGIVAAVYLFSNLGIVRVGDTQHMGEIEFGKSFIWILLIVVFNWAFNSAGMQQALQELPPHETGRRHSIFLLQVSTTVLSTVGIVAFIFTWFLWDLTLFFRYVPLLSIIFIPFFMVAFFKYGFLSTGMGQHARDLFNDANDGIIIADEGGIVRQMNPSACRILKTVALRDASRPLQQLFYRELDLKRPNRFELAPKSIPKLEHHLVVSVTPVLSHTGKQQSLIVLHDVTEEKAAEDAVNKSREDFEQEIIQRTDELVELEEKESIGVIAGSIAHDFNNLLAAVLGFATAAYQDIPDGTALKKDVGEILASARQARDVVNQLLLFSRRQQSKRQIIEVGEFLRSTLTLVESSLPPNVKLRHSILESNAYLMASQTELSQALMNLCTNAIQAMEHVDGELQIRTELDVKFSESVLCFGTYPRNKNINISVIDTGNGMDEETKKRALEPFFSTRENAIGFGLSTAFRIVSDSSGAVAVRDNDLRGTIVSICLPRLELDELPPMDANSNFANGEVIMVVDDDERLLRLMERLLSSVGYRVATYMDPHEALNAFRKTPGAFDLVISDFAMPRLNGIELGALLLDERPEIGILMVSGNISDEEIASAQLEGVKAFLRKPFVKEELLGKVRRLLDDRERISFL